MKVDLYHELPNNVPDDRKEKNTDGFSPHKQPNQEKTELPFVGLLKKYFSIALPTVI